MLSHPTILSSANLTVYEVILMVQMLPLWSEDGQRCGIDIAHLPALLFDRAIHSRKD